MRSQGLRNRKRFILLFYGFLLASFYFAALSHEEIFAASLEKQQEKLQTFVDEYVSGKKGVLGTIVQIDFQGNKPLKATNGFFDLSRKRPIKSHDRFIIGSITKTFTATLVLQLVENGKVKLDGLLIDYLPPDWAAVFAKVKYGREVTVEQLLSHRSGIFDVLSFKAFIELVLPDPSHSWTPFDVIQLVPELGEPGFKPGESFDYSNINYLILGGLIEHVTQKPYREVLQENILSRIGLKSTFHSEGPFGSNKKDVAHGYQKINGKLYDGQEFNSGYATAAGAIISTTDDLIKFLNALKSGSLFKSKQTFSQMINRIEGNEHYGLGIEVIEDSQLGLYYGHRGTFANTSSVLRCFPKHGITICTCQTFDGTAGRLKTDELLQVIISKLLGIEHTARSTTQKDILKYPELAFQIKEIQKFEAYTVRGKTFAAKNTNDRLFLISLEGKSPQKGRFQYSPSKVSLQCEVENQIFSADCLAVGQVFKTKSGENEYWVTSEEENQRITRVTYEQGEKIIIFVLFELPKKSANIEVLFS